ncbi:hypothetical protein B296_00043907 [Ensete ventricosum]|uniref:Uncharacterized protein n=1 Tax=Ensete ventricosum TaxID=4639 RepID=A0A426Z5W9_ENSVE|nr:hypothetical protein B296_00043907 [Ensete ventricosum]
MFNKSYAFMTDDTNKARYTTEKSKRSFYKLRSLLHDSYCRRIKEAMHQVTFRTLGWQTKALVRKYTRKQISCLCQIL